MKAKAKPIPADAPALVVFGRDEAGKAHASAFGAADAELAAKAAELMSLRTLAVRTDLEQALAARVPRGRVFASGKAFVPFIKAALLAELQTAALNSGLPPLKVVGGAKVELRGPIKTNLMPTISMGYCLAAVTGADCRAAAFCGLAVA